MDASDRTYQMVPLRTRLSIMTHADSIMELLEHTRKSLCDDCIALRCRLKSRQQAHSRCSQMAIEKAIVREQARRCDDCAKLKICNYRPPYGGLGKEIAPLIIPKRHTQTVQGPALLKPWFWEGHVQRVIVGWLIGGGWAISSSANTASKSPGKDIIARNQRGEFWITVKGYPQGTLKTNPSTQARHWFSHAMFDLLLYRGENNLVELAIGLPQIGKTYPNLVKRSAWGLRTCNACVLWVTENGSVVKQVIE
jgi:hypothetical protein